MIDLALLALSLVLLVISHLCAVVTGINIEQRHTGAMRLTLALAIVFGLIGILGTLFAGLQIGGAA